MKIVEIGYTINNHGTLRISRQVLQEMGLGPGDSIKIAYLTNRNSINLFQEFFILPEGIEEDRGGDHAQAIAIPNELLEAACISTDSNLQIVCFEGVIVLYETPGLQMERLKSALASLGIAAETLEKLALQENDLLNHLDTD